ncbi:MAG: hypothetical protein K2X43_22870 [Hyphomonadaceae bacterium]|nr:hypothetical protein [Hyphomonadaceae bacterium]
MPNVALAARPRLRHCTLIEDPSETATTLVVGRDYFKIERTGDRSRFLHLKSLLDGRHDLDQLSSLTGLSLASVSEVVSAFAELGLLQDRQDAPTITAQAFIEQVEDSALMWRRQIELHPLLARLASGDVRREVFIGLLIETYHYVKLLPAVIADLVPTVEDEHTRQVLAHYAEEERLHYLDYEQALSSLDRIGKWISSSHPTVGTLSLVRNFEAVGRRSALSLVCCLQLIEARLFEAPAAEADLRTIAERYDAEALVEPFIQHMKADLDMGHSGILREALKYREAIDADLAHQAVNDMHDVKHCFDVFHDSVLQYYGDISNYIPRPKVDYFAL